MNTMQNKLGEILIQQNLISQDALNTALKLQIGGQRRLGNILVRMQCITEDQLAEILSKQLDVGLINIDEEFKNEVNNIIPRYLCRKYSVIPMALKPNNILTVAMSDPSDTSAISDLERYTGKVIEPVLASYSDIKKEISRKIPLSIKDMFSPQANVFLTKFILIITLITTLSFGFYTFNYINKTIYGTVNKSSLGTVYINNDLMLIFEKDGTIQFTGRPAYGQSFIKIKFENFGLFKKFFAHDKFDFSGQQYDWINWVIANQTNS